nr:SprT-like domain-containing protein [candidate division Zixibacteria bacterium]
MKKKKHSRKALAQVNFDLFQPVILPPQDRHEVFIPGTDDFVGLELPSVPELYTMFDRINREYFQGHLPSVHISYSNRMLIAGSFTPSQNEIKIGRRYHEIFPEDIEDTLKHEMIHIINLKHDHSFRQVADRIGASLKARSHPSLRASFKYLYVCPACGREYPRRKRLRMASCGICTRGKSFDPKFKLYLKKTVRARKAGD